MKKIHIVLLAMAIACFAFSCKKSSSSGGSFTVNNQNGTVKMNIDIYTSVSDYMNSTNVLVHGTANAGGTFTFPLSKLKVGSWYYVDAYSDDYTFTNWVDDDMMLIGQDSTSPLRFKYSTGVNNAYFMILGQHTNARVSLLKNNQATTTWQAVDAFDLVTNNSIWYSMSAEQQNSKLVFNKDHTGRFYYDSTGAHYYSDFSFYGGITSYPVFTLNADQAYLTMFAINTTDPNIYGPQPTTIDTIISLFAGYEYMLVRQ